MSLEIVYGDGSGAAPRRFVTGELLTPSIVNTYGLSLGKLMETRESAEAFVAGPFDCVVSADSFVFSGVTSVGSWMEFVQAESRPELLGPDGKALELPEPGFDWAIVSRILEQPGFYDDHEFVHELAAYYDQAVCRVVASIAIGKFREAIYRLLESIKAEIYRVLRRLHAVGQHRYVVTERSWHVIHGAHPPRQARHSLGVINLPGVLA